MIYNNARLNKYFENNDLLTIKFTFYQAFILVLKMYFLGVNVQ